MNSFTFVLANSQEEAHFKIFTNDLKCTEALYLEDCNADPTILQPSVCLCVQEERDTS